MATRLHTYKPKKSTIEIDPNGSILNLNTGTSSSNDNTMMDDIMMDDQDESVVRSLQQEEMDLAKAKNTDSDDDFTTSNWNEEMDDPDPELAAQTDIDIDEDEALAGRLQEEMDDPDPELAAQTDRYIDEDEALARRLQEERDDPDPELAAQTDRYIDEDEALARRLQEERDDPDPELAAQTDRYIDEDEALARRLQEERDDQDPELAAQTDGGIDENEALARRLQEEPEWAARRNGGGGKDAEKARRIEQELKDAEVAHLLGRYEREEAMRLRAAAEQESIRNRILFRRVVPLVCCGGVLTIVLLFVFGVLGTEDIPFGGVDWFDPWSGSDGKIQWESNGNGLELEILNAMDDSWQTVLETAIHNWDNGSPVDPLTLTIRTVPYEMKCGAVTGKLKVCNGDYGKTRWRGLNEVELKGNQIVSSVAKMNDYYLNDNSLPDEKLFTMCHEIGHGFGLPHWDEDFFNMDFGNCMDYTKNLSANKQPDASNFEFLADLYGPYKSAPNSTAVTEGVRPLGRRSQSNIVNEEEEEEGSRLLLHANDYSELHWKNLDDETARLYYYLLA